MIDKILNTQVTNSMPTITQEKIIHKKDIFNLIKEIPSTPYFADTKCTIILFNNNCFDILPKLPENSIDMIFADPPYFLSNGDFTVHVRQRVSVNKRE